MRERLDQVDSRWIRPAFTAVFSLLQRGKVFEDYTFLNKYFLITCDGTGMFSSPSVHCDNCCEKHSRDGRMTYYHQILGAVVIHPDRKEVFPLCPEPISKLDGSTKNDFQKEHSRLEVIFTEDALSAKGPYLQKILAIEAHFIVGAKPPGNPGLFAW